MGGAFNHINFNLYHYAGNNPVKYVDPDGETDVSFIIYRDDNSKYSPYDKTYRGLDVIQFKNHKTGEIFNLYNAQTYVSHSEYPVENTIEPFMGGFSIQYLGNNQEKGQKLFGGFQSKFKGPVFNVQNAFTKGLSITDEYGQIIDSDDPSPIRVHSNYDLNKEKKVNMASGGCPMYEHEQADDFAAFLERSGVKPADLIYGYIKEYIEP